MTAFRHGIKASLERFNLLESFIMDGVAWVYFLFAVCHRLPTNLQKHKYLNPEKIRCNLCQCGSIEDEEHVFTCPALAAIAATIFERLWTMCSGSGVYPTAILRYQQVPTSRKCGVRLWETYLLSIIDSIRH